MKTTDEDADVFEITDFTTASEWERFIARLEELIHEWKLPGNPTLPPLGKNEVTSGTWDEKTESLMFADFKFVVTHHYLKQANQTEISAATPTATPSSTPAATPTVEQKGAPGENTDEQADKHAESHVDKQEANEESVPTGWVDMMSVENDFPPRAHCLCRWYGLREFLVIAPASNTECIGSESRLNIVRSSVSIALNNTGCKLPMFVQAQQKWRKLYFGECVSPGFRTNFEMVHLKNVLPQYSHLAGLLDVFKAKLVCPVSPVPPCSVAVRFTYILQDWPTYSWPQPPPDIDSLTGGEVGFTEYSDLPFGACEDPISELCLSTTWPSLSEEMIVDNDVYSDLDPLQAPHWSVRLCLTVDPQCLLGDYLNEFVSLCRRKESTDQLLGKLVREDDDQNEKDISQALHRLTEPGVPYHIPSVGTVVTRATSKLQIRPEEAPIPADMLNEILLFLFPDAKQDGEKLGKGSKTTTPTAASERSHELPGESDAENSEKSAEEHQGTDHANKTQNDRLAQMQEMFRQFKSAPLNSLTYRLSVCICIVNHSYGGLRAVAHLWQEFVLEMRYRWENNFEVPDLEAGSPNMGCSLLHQKLQMLNCCIRHKKSREALQSSVDIPDGATGVSPSNSQSQLAETGRASTSRARKASELNCSSSDEEFFECEDEESSDLDDVLPNSADDVLPNSAEGGKSRGQRDVVDAEEKSESEASEKGKKQAKEDENRSVSRGRARDGLERQESIVSKASELDFMFTDTFTHQAEGRLRACPNMKLLNVDEQLYIPITQEPAPMTEDMLEEHAEVLAKLGTSAEGAHLRARMQSACLLSDMEAFKASNPGSMLGDFVRWYSPRDWVEEEQVDEEGNVSMKGQLSARMQIPGNMWAEVWQSAKPVPVRRQKRLFDDTKEAEKVLHHLAAMKPAEAALRLMPMLINAAIAKLLEQEESSITVVKNLINTIITRATKAMRAPRPEIKRYEDLIRQVSVAEVLITRAQSLKTKFSEGNEQQEALSDDLLQFIASLLEQQPEINILGAARGPVGSVIHNLFAAAQKSQYMLLEDTEDEDMDMSFRSNSSGIKSDFPIPAGKEYILRTSVPCPAPWSRTSPQRMFCVIQKDEFRLAGAFSADTTFQ